MLLLLLLLLPENGRASRAVFVSSWNDDANVRMGQGDRRRLPPGVRSKLESPTTAVACRAQERFRPVVGLHDLLCQCCNPASIYISSYTDLYGDL